MYRTAKNTKMQKGFTLVELLVVISIIALLLSILMPALGKVREQARIVVCAANSKQIGTIINICQASNNGRVPPMLNMWAPGVDPTIPQNKVWLSLALRDYSGLKTTLPATMNPDMPWSYNAMNEYKAKYLPKFFICPLGRGKASNPTDWWSKWANISIGSKTYYTRETLGAIDGYFTWLYPQKAGSVFDANPKGLPNGQRKYGNLNWFTRESSLDRGGNPQPIRNHDKLIGSKWDSASLKACGAGSSSAATVSYCGWGQYSAIGQDGQTPNGIYNYGKHKKQGQGGTNAIFADGHVEWVPGTQIDETGVNN